MNDEVTPEAEQAANAERDKIETRELEGLVEIKICGNQDEGYNEITTSRITVAAFNADLSDQERSITFTV